MCSSDLSAAGAFATTLTLVGGIPGCLNTAGNTIEVHAHGMWTTNGSTGSSFGLEVGAGGNATLCPAGTNYGLTAGSTNGSFDVVAYIQINTTGAGGTATCWGSYYTALSGGSLGTATARFFNQATTTAPAFNTTGSTITIQPTTFTVESGASITLTGLYAIVTGQ